MKGIPEWLATAEDSGRQAKIKRLMKGITADALLAGLANAGGTE